MSHFCDRSDIRTESVFETNVRERHDACCAVNHLFVIDVGDRVTLRADELNLCTPRALSEPHVPHRRKLEFPHNYLLTLSKMKGTGNSVDPRRHARHNRNFVSTSMDKCRKSRSCLLISLHPELPGRSVLVPARHVLLKACLDVF